MMIKDSLKYLFKYAKKERCLFCIEYLRDRNTYRMWAYYRKLYKL